MVDRGLYRGFQDGIHRHMPEIRVSKPRECATCHKTDSWRAKFQKCPCGTHYCGRTCQKTDWYSGHKESCMRNANN